ncbi:hypothetical protein [Spiroplasma mirum]|uniref:hypothetical protein n=1 Tax=Spiroplasma mirum TaxID=2144 RepID=UPI0004AFEE91|nr:hypothetical protein [Spiroplasma atrichopogonis]
MGPPLAAVASHHGFAYGYVIFQNFQYYNYVLIFIAGGILMGFLRQPLPSY